MCRAKEDRVCCQQAHIGKQCRLVLQRVVIRALVQLLIVQACMHYRQATLAFQLPAMGISG